MTTSHAMLNDPKHKISHSDHDMNKLICLIDDDMLIYLSCKVNLTSYQDQSVYQTRTNIDNYRIGNVKVSHTKLLISLSNHNKAPCQSAYCNSSTDIKLLDITADGINAMSIENKSPT